MGWSSMTDFVTKGLLVFLYQGPAHVEAGRWGREGHSVRIWYRPQGPTSWRGTIRRSWPGHEHSSLALGFGEDSCLQKASWDHGHWPEGEA